MSTCLISIGSNLGDARANVSAGLELLGHHPQIEAITVSQLRETKPAGGPADQENFLNAAARVETTLSPQELLAELQRIENQLGRIRQVHWGPRVIDLDLLLFDDLVLSTDDLELPHPRMAFRRFVMEPADEIAAEMLHPVIGWTVSQIIAHLDSAPNYVAVTGIAGSGTTAVVQAAADRIPVNALFHPVAESASVAETRDEHGSAELKILRQRAELLQTIPRESSRDTTGSEQPTFTLSDFWFEQTAAYVEGHVPSEFQADFESLLSSVPRPKLLVVLQQTDTGSQNLTDLQQRIVRRSRLPGRGPTLWLNADDLHSATDEVVAAIQAMQ